MDNRSLSITKPVDRNTNNGKTDNSTTVNKGGPFINVNII